MSEAAAENGSNGTAAATQMAPPPRMLTHYREKVVPALQEKFEYKNVMEIPRLSKIMINMGVGEASRDIKELDVAMADLAIISGQWPKMTRAKMSVAQFKVRTGMPVGCFVTLRGRRMYDFLDRLVSVAVPRIRDFRGLPANSFDGRGNYSMGIREHTIFVEVDITKVTRTRGMDITFVTTSNSDAEARALLDGFHFPFRK